MMVGRGDPIDLFNHFRLSIEDEIEMKPTVIRFWKKQRSLTEEMSGAQKAKIIE